MRQILYAMCFVLSFASFAQTKKEKEQKLRKIYEEAYAISHTLDHTDYSVRLVMLCDEGLAMYKKPEKKLVGLFAQIYELRALGYMNKGFYNKALNDYNESIKLYSLTTIKPIECYRYRGNVLLKLEKYNDAITDMTMSIEREPDFAQQYYYRALAFEKIGELQKARIDLAMAKKLNPNDPLYKDYTL